MNKQKLVLEPELKAKLDDLRKILSDISLDGEESKIRGGHCGEQCMVTCSWYCEDVCAGSCRGVGTNGCAYKAVCPGQPYLPNPYPS